MKLLGTPVEVLTIDRPNAVETIVTMADGYRQTVTAVFRKGGYYPPVQEAYDLADAAIAAGARHTHLSR